MKTSENKFQGKKKKLINTAKLDVGKQFMKGLDGKTSHCWRVATVLATFNKEKNKQNTLSY